MEKNGFTLIELLGILVLLGIIILVAVPAIIKSNSTAKTNEGKEFDQIAKNACEAYEAVYGKNAAKDKTLEELKNAGYIQKDLTKPNGATWTKCS